MTLPGGADCREGLAHSFVRIGEVVRVQADVELGQVEAEDLHARAEVGEPAVCDSLSAVRPQAAVDQLEVGEEVGGRAVAGRPSTSASPSRCQTKESLRR